MKSHTNVEYRTTKEILEGIIRNASKYSKFQHDTIYGNRMYHVVKPISGTGTYEIKITKKVRGEDRVEPNGISKNKDTTKQEFLEELQKVLAFVFPRVNYHDGNVLVSDNNNDFIISLVKKMK